ncbi:hypothetical protein [Halorarius halobius]|uniref:hypothetical protein n=1 Tax=Halorarius halobius TaxID=2962671 RepID=UPI0020CD35BE|nr:hypothetical protein [Halorarius halobius]
MNVPDGELVRSRVVPDARAALEAALDRRLTGYAVLAPTAVLDPRREGAVLTFEAGVPVVAYHVESDRGGSAALGALAEPGPYRVELYESSPGDLDAVHDVEELRVAPGAPAEQVAGAPALAERTRRAAPADRDGAGDRDAADDPVEAFLADTERIEAIREEAREEAERRAEEWGFDDAVEE